jgi:hypothetical protein
VSEWPAYLHRIRRSKEPGRASDKLQALDLQQVAHLDSLESILGLGSNHGVHFPVHGLCLGVELGLLGQREEDGGDLVEGLVVQEAAEDEDHPADLLWEVFE